MWLTPYKSEATQNAEILLSQSIGNSVLYKERFERINTAGIPVNDVYHNYYEHVLGGNVGKLAFITINLKKDTSINTAIKLVSNILKKKWLTKCHYTYEQRGECEEELGSGLHVHMLIPDIHKPRSHICNEIYNTVKNYIGNKHHVYYLQYPMTMYEDKLAYLNGDKWDSAKDDKCKWDIIWRNSLNLETSYNYN